MHEAATDKMHLLHLRLVHLATQVIHCPVGGPSNDRRTPQDAADRHRTLFLVTFSAPLRSRQHLTMI